MDPSSDSESPVVPVNGSSQRSRKRRLIREDEDEIEEMENKGTQSIDDQNEPHSVKRDNNSDISPSNSSSDKVVVISDSDKDEDPPKFAATNQDASEDEESENEELAAYLQKKKQFGKGIMSKVAKKHSRQQKRSQVATAASADDTASCNAAVAALRHQLQVERELHTGWIPSLSAINASTLDARERMYAALSRLADPSAEEGGSTESHEYARRRQTQDSFLESLATKYAKPLKSKTTKAKNPSSASASTTAAKRKQQSAAATDDAKDQGEGDAERSMAAASSSVNVASVPSSTDFESVDSSHESRPKKKLKSKKSITATSAVPDDMEFLLLQEKLGWDKKLSKK